MRGLISALGIFLLLTRVGFAMTSTNFQIDWDAINTGGDDFATSANFQLNDTLGGFADGTSTGVLYALKAGYRAAEASPEALGLTLGAQESVTRVTYSNFSSSTKTVTVSSAGFLIAGDYIAAVETAGFAERVAVGRVTSITNNVVTVDAWDGDQASMATSSNVGANYVYRLGGTEIAFGTLTAEVENTSVAVASVASTAVNGYSLYLQADGNLVSDSHSMNAVSDGAVTNGYEEYGMEVTGARAFGAGVDRAVSSTQRMIADSSTTSSAVGDRLGMIYKLATIFATPAGSYQQTVYYTLTGKY